MYKSHRNSITIGHKSSDIYIQDNNTYNSRHHNNNYNKSLYYSDYDPNTIDVRNNHRSQSFHNSSSNNLDIENNSNDNQGSSKQKNNLTSYEDNQRKDTQSSKRSNQSINKKKNKSNQNIVKLLQKTSSDGIQQQSYRPYNQSYDGSAEKLRRQQQTRMQYSQSGIQQSLEPSQLNNLNLQKQQSGQQQQQSLQSSSISQKKQEQIQNSLIQFQTKNNDKITQQEVEQKKANNLYPHYNDENYELKSDGERDGNEADVEEEHNVKLYTSSRLSIISNQFPTVIDNQQCQQVYTTYLRKTSENSSKRRNNNKSQKFRQNSVLGNTYSQQQILQQKESDQLNSSFLQDKKSEYTQSTTQYNKLKGQSVLRIILLVLKQTNYLPLVVLLVNVQSIMIFPSQSVFSQPFFGKFFNKWGQLLIIVISLASEGIGRQIASVFKKEDKWVVNNYVITFVVVIRFVGIVYYSIIRESTFDFKKHGESDLDLMNFMALLVPCLYMFFGGFGGVVTYQQCLKYQQYEGQNFLLNFSVTILANFGMFLGALLSLVYLYDYDFGTSTHDLQSN